MAKAGGCLFSIGYFFYTRTRIGNYYHHQDIAKAREKYQGEGHTIIQPATYGKLQVTAVPVALDNYSYIILDTESNTCVVVDPGDPEPVQKVLDEMKVLPAAVLTTHKHWDHSAGNAAMKQRYRDIRVYGGVGDNVPDTTHTVSDKDELQFGGLHFRVQCASGHTAGQVVYLLDGTPLEAPDCLFSGDHLFLGGCGRMFECSPMKMLKSLDAVSRLCPDTLIWPGHEYATDNLEFVCHLDPDNSQAQNKFSWSKAQRQNRLRTSNRNFGSLVVIKHRNAGGMSKQTSLVVEKEYDLRFCCWKGFAIVKNLTWTTEESILAAAGMITGGERTEFVTPGDDVRARALKEIRERKDKFKYIM